MSGVSEYMRLQRYVESSEEVQDERREPGKSEWTQKFCVRGSARHWGSVFTNPGETIFHIKLTVEQTRRDQTRLCEKQKDVCRREPYKASKPQKGLQRTSTGNSTHRRITDQVGEITPWPSPSPKTTPPLVLLPRRFYLEDTTTLPFRTYTKIRDTTYFPLAEEPNLSTLSLSQAGFSESHVTPLSSANIYGLTVRTQPPKVQVVIPASSTVTFPEITPQETSPVDAEVAIPQEISPAADIKPRPSSSQSLLQETSPSSSPPFHLSLLNEPSVSL